MLTLGVKRRIKLDVELSKKNVNGYRYILRKVKNIEVLTETEFETLIQELKKPIPTQNTNYTQDFNIRLEYDRETDITKVIEKLKETFNVDFVSKDYKNRNNNNNRIYINVKSK